MVLFDTLKASRRLRDVGFDEEGEGQRDRLAFAEDIGERLATKDDLARLEERLEQHLTIRIGVMITGATGVLLAAIGIAKAFSR